jgi:hypothetical protein
MVNAKRSTQVICHKNGRPKVFYKITNTLEKHYDFQYKEGLNILQQQYDPTEECGPSGLFVTDMYNLPDFFHYGCNIREIHIPKDATIKSFINKHKVDKLIFLKKYNYFEFIKKNRLHKNFDNEAFLKQICRNIVENKNIPKLLDILRHNTDFIQKHAFLIDIANPNIFKILLNEHYYSIPFLKNIVKDNISCDHFCSIINRYLTTKR